MGYLYELNGLTNQANAYLSDDMLSAGTFRNGQEIVIKTQSDKVNKLVNDSGRWSVDQTPNNGHLHFVFDVAGTALAKSSDIALHWAMSCGNDTIEGSRSVPEPGSLWLALIGGLAACSRRRVVRA